MKSLFFIVLLTLFIAGFISLFWVRGIDYMKKNHPDYKGEDFLNWDREEINKVAGRDSWDDNKVHTEGGL